MSNDSSTTKEVNGFCGGIQALFQKAQEICNSDHVISSAEQLEKLEQKVCDLTDQLQAIIIEERLQSSLDSEEVREREADLIANLPWKLKNKGLRDVVITIRCGVTIVVCVPYYVGKKKRKKRGSDGFIIRHRVFEGKMSDSKSLDHIVRELEKEFSDKSMPTVGWRIK